MDSDSRNFDDYRKRAAECRDSELVNIRRGLTIGMQEALKDAEKFRIQLDIVTEELASRAYISIGRNKGEVREPVSRLSSRERRSLLTDLVDKSPDKPKRKGGRGRRFVMTDAKKLIWKLHREGMSIADIVRQLDKAGHRTQAGRTWSRPNVWSTIQRLSKQFPGGEGCLHCGGDGPGCCAAHAHDEHYHGS